MKLNVCTFIMKNVYKTVCMYVCMLVMIEKEKKEKNKCLGLKPGEILNVNKKPKWTFLKCILTSFMSDNRIHEYSPELPS